MNNRGAATAIMPAPLYRERLNSPLLTLFLLTAATAVTAASAILAIKTGNRLLLLMLMPVPLMLVPVGGMEILLTREKLEVRLGRLHIRVLETPLDCIESIRMVRFWKIICYFGWCKWKPGFGSGAGLVIGNRGVRFKTKTGKLIAVGSSTPELLADLISEYSGAAKLPEEDYHLHPFSGRP